MRDGPQPGRQPRAAVVAVLLAVASLATPLSAEPPAGAAAHARALSLVLERMFRPGASALDQSRQAAERPDRARTWRVRAVPGSQQKYDVVFYVGDRPVCVWRADLPAARVFPDGCSLELWEDPRA